MALAFLFRGRPGNEANMARLGFVCLAEPPAVPHCVLDRYLVIFGAITLLVYNSLTN